MSNHPADHRDMLSHVESAKGEPIFVKKPDWIVHDEAPSAPATPLDGKKTQMSKLLVHDAHTPSNGSFTPGPAPYKEDGVSTWERDGTAKKKKKLCFPDGATEAVDADEDEEEEEEEELTKENDPRWNIKRRTPVNAREGEFEKNFRSRESYSGRKSEEEEGKEAKEKGVEEVTEKDDATQKTEEEKGKEEAAEGNKDEDKEKIEKDRKIKVPRHLVSGPLW